MHIAICVPTPENANADFALGNFQDIISRTHKDFPDWKITTCYKYGTRTDQNRNVILKELLDDGTVDYVLWLDADMLYPPDIVHAYFETTERLKVDIDVIGCLYFKRSYPYSPIAYTDNPDPEVRKVKPYKSVLPSAIREDTLYEVTGIGYGGMMVNMKVYEKLGEKKWTVYGRNFHLPFDSPDHLTHDLNFCKDVIAAGMKIHLHGGVRPGHLRTTPTTMDDWKRVTEEEYRFHGITPKVLVVMPSTNMEQARKAGEIMRRRAGADCDIAIVEDDSHFGFIKVLNMTVEQTDHKIIVYTAQDALVAENWLKEALIRMLTTNAGLLSFNTGKWNGQLASFGMVQREWVKNIYGGPIFFPEYNAHYADTELTQIAKQQNRYAYAEKAIMLEVDLDKALGGGKGVVKEDKKLYKKRKKAGFGGLVTSPDILDEFS